MEVSALREINNKNQGKKLKHFYIFMTSGGKNLKGLNT